MILLHEHDESMEWVLVHIVIFVFSSVQATAPTPGVCRKYSRIKDRGSYRIIKLAICCNQYYISDDGGCVECPIGHYSKGEVCTKCENGLYGQKCSFTCSCNPTERCDHVKGCILIDARTVTDDTFKKFPSGGQGTDNERSTPYITDEEDDDILISITLREIIISVVIIFIGLLVFLGLLQVCWKRQRRILITPIENQEMHADKVRQSLIEERSEGVYDEIDESAMSTKVTPSIARPSSHSSYLDVLDSPRNTINIKGNPSRLSMEMFSSQSEPARQISLRHSLEENICDLNIQSWVRNEYSDGYLKPRVIAKHHSIHMMLKNQGTLFLTKDKVIKKENRGPIYDAPAYDGISRSVSYDRLVLANNVGNNSNGSVLAHTPIDPSKVQLDKKSSHPKCTTLASKRKTI